MMSEPAVKRQYEARSPLLLGFGGLAALVGGSVGWSVLASISAAVIGAGEVEVENSNRTVEHIDGGTVSEILVGDGDRVSRGQALLRFDDARLRLEENIYSAQYAEAEAQLNRLQAEISDADAVEWSPELRELVSRDPRVAAILEQQNVLFQARRETRAGEIGQLHEQIAQLNAEIRGLEANAMAIVRQTELLAQDLERQRLLLEQGLAPLDRILELERMEQASKGQQGANEAAVARTRVQIAEIRSRIIRIDSRRIEEAAALSGEISQQRTALLENLLVVRERLQSLEVKAPEDGIVFGMAVSTPLEVVNPGEPILQIVPEDIGFIARGRIDPIHVDRLFPGQSAVLRFSSLPARTTPEFEGDLLWVSADVVYDENTGLSWYEIEVSIDAPRTASGMVGSAEDLALTPGMPVEIYIQSESRSPISYLVKPLTDYFSRSMREE